MLPQETIAIIKSTVPVLEIHGTTITKRFYERLFESHPELLNIFNHANQKQGRQQTALANAVYAAAANIDKLESILPVVRGIAHKHRSLGVKPEHYPSSASICSARSRKCSATPRRTRLSAPGAKPTA